MTWPEALVKIAEVLALPLMVWAFMWAVRGD
jgi:hypothetical protein